MTLEAIATQPFGVLDRALARLERGLRALDGFRPRPVAPDLARAEGSYAGKPLTLRAEAFSARGVGYGRVVRIDGPGTWILNAVAWNDDAFAIPILGLELLVFRGRMHLIVADMFPVVARDAGLMDTLGAAFDDVGEDPPMPSWAARIFSRRPVFRKPRDPAALGEGARAVTAVSTAWLERVHAAMPAPDAGEARARREAYVRAHAEDEPANPFLGKAFGPETGRRLVDEILFPSAR